MFMNSCRVKKIDQINPLNLIGYPDYEKAIKGTLSEHSSFYDSTEIDNEATTKYEKTDIDVSSTRYGYSTGINSIIR
jgi:hypothetical protein